ncbi:MAG: phospholipid carrier-dependent glycosyltransferase, partial [Candidatus Limnocylindria bacterium]
MGSVEGPSIERQSGWSQLDWFALGLVMLGASFVRLAGLDRPVGWVFDEIFYARNACQYVIGTADCGVEQLVSRAHPPLGNWVIAAGIELLGYEEFAWRLPVAMLGVLGVALLYLLVRRLLRRMPPLAATVGAFVAAALLAGDFLHLAHSRVAMLDVPVTTLVIAAVLFAVLDRDRFRPPAWDRRPGGRLAPLALGRPWRLLAGASLGAATAVKWSGAYVALAVIPLVVAWEIALRRRVEGDPDRQRPWREAARLALREEGWRSVVLLGVVPVAVYLAAYIGRMPGEVLALPWQEGSVWRGIWEHQHAMLSFHTTLAGSHPYESPAWSWLLIKRPVALFFSTDGGAYREILSMGSPLAWAGTMAAFALALVGWARGGWAVLRPEAVLVAAALATYLPWLVLSGDRSQTFIWYILPTLPFLYAAVGLVTAWTWSQWFGRVAVGTFAAASLALFVFFFPVLTALPTSPDDWRARMWV